MTETVRPASPDAIPEESPELLEIYRLLLDGSPDPIFAFAPEGRYLYVNRAFAEGVQRTVGQIVGKRIWDVFPQAEADQRYAALHHVFQSGMEKVIEVCVPRTDGDRYYVTTITPVKDDTGQVSTVICSSKEITERKRAELALRQSEEVNRAISSVTIDYSFIVDFTADGKSELRWASENLTEITGRSAAGIPTPETWQTIIHPDDQPAFAEFMRRTLVEGREGSIECRSSLHEGRIRWIQVFTKPLKGPDGRVQTVIGAVKDISARKQAESEREKLRDQLLQAQKMESVGRLAGGVAHDFNNMLQAILGYTEIALGRSSVDAGLRADLEQIQKTANRSADLTRQLLAFARKQTVAPRVLDLNETIAGALDMLRRLIGEDIELLWFPGQGLRAVRIDPTQIDQVLANLCVNARDAIAGAGRITIETANVDLDGTFTARHPDCPPGAYVAITFGDSGQGMDREVMAHLFEPFFTTKGIGRGTGLGLATVFGIVTQNGGAIDAESEPGRGTTFRIHLPRHAEAPAPRDIPPQGSCQEGQETILLVEDELAILTMGRLMLERLGYHVLAAATPSEALHLAEGYSDRIDLLVTDVVLPEINGRELALRILVSHPEVKWLFMSGYTAEVIAPQGVLDPGVHFIQKPFTFSDLAARVREALGPDGGR